MFVINNDLTCNSCSVVVDSFLKLREQLPDVLMISGRKEKISLTTIKILRNILALVFSVKSNE